MNRKKYISKLLIGVFLIAVYFNTLFTQFFCDYSYLIDLAETEHEHPMGHDHHHGDNTVPPVEHNDKGNHNESKDGNCCNDKTVAFFTFQTNSATTFFQLKDTFFKTVINFSNTTLVNTSSVRLDRYFYNKLLPPRIPDIRVFLHSFLI